LPNNELKKLVLKESKLILLDQLVVLKVQQDLPYKVLAAVRPQLLVETLDAVFLKTSTALKVLLEAALLALVSPLGLILKSADLELAPLH
tara:strand:+ start:107 stop:376 length:270 start_codon:yes stop_codon:yes gene_type:complete